MNWKQRGLTPLALTLALVAAGCGGSDGESASATTEQAATTAEAGSATTATAGDATTSEVPTTSSEDAATPTSEAEATGDGEEGDAPGTGDCEATASTFRDVESANDNLDAPEVAATCEGDTVVVTSNAIPDFTYVATSPGDPAAQ
ncbi:MAG: hypothetical protein R2878_00015, partial [Thermoleophilia bacterium]